MYKQEAQEGVIPLGPESVTATLSLFPDGQFSYVHTDSAEGGLLNFGTYAEGRFRAIEDDSISRGGHGVIRFSSIDGKTLIEGKYGVYSADTLRIESNSNSERYELHRKSGFELHVSKGKTVLDLKGITTNAHPAPKVFD
ncbi:MAG: hypothetical protein AAF636_17780 [Pseudomonadota bacterium]